MLEIIHRKSYEYREQIKALGCKWNPSKKAWIAPNEETFNIVAQMLEDTDDIRSSCSGRQGYSEMTSEGIDDVLNNKIAAQPQAQSINYIPTIGDALKLFGEEQVNRYWDERISVEAAKILASGEMDETEIFDRLNYDGIKGKSVDLLIDLVNFFRKNPPGKSESEFRYIELETYRNKGINAYLAPVKNGNVDYTQNIYGEPIDDDAKDKAHRGKRHTVKVRIDNLTDGVYVYKEAGGADFNKSRYGWLKIKGGEIIDEGTGKPPIN